MARNVTKRNVLILAVILGLIASLLTYKMLQAAEEERNQKQVQMVVARYDIPRFSIISEAQIETKQVPLADAPPDVCTDPATVIDNQSLVDIKAGAPIRQASIRPKKGWPPPGMRAMSVAIDPVIAVAGFLEPGDRVDVLATFDRDGTTVAETVVQNVELLALGSTVQPGSDDPERKSSMSAHQKDTATLLVTLDQAKRITAAENKGKLRIVLRAPGDTTIEKSAPVKIQSGTAPSRPEPAPRVTVERQPAPPVFNYPRYVPPAAPRTQTTTPAKKGHEIEVIKGGNVEKVVVDE